MNCSEISFFVNFGSKSQKITTKKFFTGESEKCKSEDYVGGIFTWSNLQKCHDFTEWNYSFFEIVPFLQIEPRDITSFTNSIAKFRIPTFFRNSIKIHLEDILSIFQIWICAKIAFFVSSFVPLVELKIKIRKFLKRKNILSQDGEILQWTFVGGRSDHLVKRFMSHWLDINWVITQQKLTQHCWMYHQGKSVGVKRGVKVGVNK